MSLCNHTICKHISQHFPVYISPYASLYVVHVCFQSHNFDIFALGPFLDHLLVQQQSQQRVSQRKFYNPFSDTACAKTSTSASNQPIPVAAPSTFSTNKGGMNKN